MPAASAVDMKLRRDKRPVFAAPARLFIKFLSVIVFSLAFG
jgi:hypothetical protein